MKINSMGYMILSLFMLCGLQGAITLKTDVLNDTTIRLNVAIPIDKNDAIYSDYFNFSIDKPTITLSKEWHSPTSTQDIFDPKFKENKKGFTGNITISMEATAENLEQFERAHLIMGYYPKSANHMKVEVLPIVIDQKLNQPEQQVIQTPSEKNAPAPVAENNEILAASQEKLSWSDRISNLIKTTDSLALRILLVLLLGLLMSLTPCIYPMIPITAGILQSQASSSFVRNLLLALSYTMGIAVTFASLGLLAAYTGQICGNFFTNPYFIIAIVALLAYLAGSMLGLYEMYIPKIMQPKHQKVKQGSFISAFMFGAASGTFASPCLSPGLCLLLSIVSAMKSVFMGFVLLFSFGVGLSLPLLLIGSFSSSLALLPRAGMWMIEVKKMFGIIMLLMCLYFLNYILPLHIILIMASILMLTFGIWYLATIKPYDSRSARFFKNCIGIFSIATAVVLGFNGYKSNQKHECAVGDAFWLSNYKQALGQAKEQNKKLFVDVGAPYCSICKAIDKTLFADMKVKEKLCEFVCVKLDGSQKENEAFTKKYEILGFPAIMILNPEDGTVIKRWGGELYGISTPRFIQDLASLN